MRTCPPLGIPFQETPYHRVFWLLDRILNFTLAEEIWLLNRSLSSRESSFLFPNHDFDIFSGEFEMVCIFSYMVSHFGLSILDGCIWYKRRILFIHHLKSRHFSAMMSHWHMNPSLLDALVPGPVCFHFTWWILVLKATNNMLFKSRLLESTSLHHNPPIHKLPSHTRLLRFYTQL